MNGYFDGSGVFELPNLYGKASEVEMAARPMSDVVSWGQLLAVLTLLAVVIGGGFAFLHGHMSEIRGDLKDITKQFSATRENLGKISGKVDVLIQEAQKRR